MVRYPRLITSLPIFFNTDLTLFFFYSPQFSFLPFFSFLAIAVFFSPSLLSLSQKFVFIPQSSRPQHSLFSCALFTPVSQAFISFFTSLSILHFTLLQLSTLYFGPHHHSFVLTYTLHNSTLFHPSTPFPALFHSSSLLSASTFTPSPQVCPNTFTP